MGPKRKSDRKYEKCKYYDRGFFKNGSECSKDHPDMFVKIQTALMTTAKAGTQIHASMKIDVDLTGETSVCILMLHLLLMMVDSMLLKIN